MEQLVSLVCVVGATGLQHGAFKEFLVELKRACFLIVLYLHEAVYHSVDNLHAMVIQGAIASSVCGNALEYVTDQFAGQVLNHIQAPNV